MSDVIISTTMELISQNMRMGLSVVGIAGLGLFIWEYTAKKCNSQKKPSVKIAQVAEKSKKFCERVGSSIAKISIEIYDAGFDILKSMAPFVECPCEYLKGYCDRASACTKYPFVVGLGSATIVGLLSYIGYYFKDQIPARETFEYICQLLLPNYKPVLVFGSIIGMIILAWEALARKRNGRLRNFEKAVANAKETNDSFVKVRKTRSANKETDSDETPESVEPIEGGASNASNKPSILINKLAINSKKWSYNLGYWTAKISSFYTYINLEEIWETFNDLVGPMFSLLSSPMYTLKGYFVTAYEYATFPVLTTFALALFTVLSGMGLYYYKDGIMDFMKLKLNY